MNKQMTTEWDVTLSKIENLQTILWNVKHKILETLDVNIFEEVLTKEQLNLTEEIIFNYFTDKFPHDYGEWDYSDIASDLICEGNTWLVEYLKKWIYPTAINTIGTEMLKNSDIRNKNFIFFLKAKIVKYTPWMKKKLGNNQKKRT